MVCLTACMALWLAATDTGSVPPGTGPLAAADAFDAARWSPPSPGTADPAALSTPSPADTTPARSRAFEYSDAYGTRLAIHRVASYAMLPLFAAQYVTGDQLMRKGSAAPQWARSAHGPLAAGVAALFTVNTVTGGWNLIEARHDPEGRTRRTLHGVLMLAADAGFVATGMLANQAENDQGARDLHRTVALGSIGTSLLSYAIMLPIFGRR